MKGINLPKQGEDPACKLHLLIMAIVKRRKTQVNKIPCITVIVNIQNVNAYQEFPSAYLVKKISSHFGGAY